MWLPTLHAVRGIAALAVLVLHAYWTWPLAFSPVVRKLYLCVDLFFVLSGFVICLRYAGSFEQGTSIAQFMRKRFARLAPVYYASGLVWLVAFSLMAAMAGAPMSLADTAASILRYGLALDALYTGPDPKLNPVAWSIMVEMAAYLLFALCFCFVRGRGRRIALAGLIASGALAWLVANTADLNLVAGPGAFIRCIAGFHVGVLICLVYQWKGQAGLYALASALLVLLAGLAVSGAAADYLVFCVLGLVILALVQWHHRLPAMPRPLMALGDISFSLYLWHFIVSVAMAKVLDKLGTGVTLHDGERFVEVPAAFGIIGIVAYCLVALVAAWFSYRLFEAKNLFRRRAAGGEVVAKGANAA